MQKKTLEVLEYNKILDKLKKYAKSNIVKKQISKFKPFNEKEKIQKELDNTSMMISTIKKIGHLDLFGIYDFSDILVYVEKRGILTPKDLIKISSNLRSVSYLKSMENNIEEEYIKDLFFRLHTNDFLMKEIDRSFISEEEIADNASSLLFSIRKKISKKEDEIKQKINFYTKNSKFDDVLQDKVVTVRDGRYVVPVKSGKRTSLNGIIHDRSQSGSTLFIEPTAIVELNNQINDLKIQENQEIERILDRLSRFVESFSDELRQNQNVMIILDTLQAKAEFAIQNNYTKPVISNKKIIDIKNAKHPLLTGNVVPIDVSIGKNYNTIIITGPNTGGKTVSLKTVGIIELMVQTGLFIPADENSTVFIFDDIFLDIGDKQSIELSLSTFSASLTNIVDILNNADENSLVLLDEIGAGTDPTEGAALAISILNYLLQNHILTLATTHYSELKYFAVETKNVINASVEFDIETLSPTYKLITGTPGKSNAFEISQRLGLKKEIIENAKSLISKDDKNINLILEEIESNRNEIEKKNKEIEEYKKKISQQKDFLEYEIERLDKEEKDIIKKAEEKAKKLLDDAKEKSDEMLKEAKKSKNANISEIDRTLTSIREKYKKSTKNYKNDSKLELKTNVISESIKKGDSVNILGLNQNGIVIDNPSDNGDIKVQVGIFKLNSNVKNVKKIKKQHENNFNSTTNTKIRKTMNISPTIDLRGDNLEDAIRKLDKYLDDAFLSNLSEIKIIHGKGTGVLRFGINKYLEKNKLVKEKRSGNDKEGGFGVTIVKI